ncbi:SlyX family protein [Neisseria sp. ZJ106]|uniref:Protein SlyX homolog n=1 Tax=Neisseria lisongii TaxID=2912188 RepID=A0AAW5AKV7_9NEIS|nr:SlyX family protein [Neisseria lisongii]MCF7521911.1 SlyX family protein [Neisseria lisongii]MCF7529100.1 SlyX family protein [Neisseria lisongii]WCL71126.1 SlyX family protein [Neisseria lisongii]
MNDWEHRITELEIQTALQADLIDSLNTIVADMQQTLDLQQEQLRLLYRRMQDKNADEGNAYSLRDEIPPHY